MNINIRTIIFALGIFTIGAIVGIAVVMFSLRPIQPPTIPSQPVEPMATIITTVPGYVQSQPIEPSQEGLSRYDDDPVTDPIPSPMTVYYLVAHRSALDGKTVTLQGVITVVATEDQVCRPDRGACMHPFIKLADTMDERNTDFDVLVQGIEGVTEVNFPPGYVIQIPVIVEANKAVINLTKSGDTKLIGMPSPIPTPTPECPPGYAPYRAHPMQQQYECITEQEMKEKPSPNPLMICLSSETDISTAHGSVKVKDIKVGTLIWTQNKKGEKIESPVIKISRVPVSKDHIIIHLVLTDGRELYVSPGHPTANGLTVGELKLDQSYDGSIITKVEQVRYGGTQTYDILPAGDTGYYWANGILMGSTL